MYTLLLGASIYRLFRHIEPVCARLAILVASSPREGTMAAGLSSFGTRTSGNLSVKSTCTPQPSPALWTCWMAATWPLGGTTRRSTSSTTRRASLSHRPHPVGQAWPLWSYVSSPASWSLQASTPLSQFGISSPK